MEFYTDFSRFSKGFENCITTIDSHTQGEATRLVVNGLGKIEGGTMTEKLSWFQTHRDGVRSLLTKEPRGSADILAAVVTESVTPGAAFGLLYMDARRYPYLCGHATIGAVVSLFNTGFLLLDSGEKKILIDTPSGVMAAGVSIRHGRLESVSIDMVPSFVYATDQEIKVDGFGSVMVDLVCTGGFFAMVDCGRLGIPPVLENRHVLTDLGMKIIDAANCQLQVRHPERPDVRTVDVTEFYDSGINKDPLSGRGMVIYGESHTDRSPCGTGTAAKLALLHHRKKIGINQDYINQSPLGTSFQARITEKGKIGDADALVVRITGMAYLTGLHHFIVETDDPFQQGFIM